MAKRKVVKKKKSKRAVYRPEFVLADGLLLRESRTFLNKIYGSSEYNQKIDCSISIKGYKIVNYYDKNKTFKSKVEGCYSFMDVLDFNDGTILNKKQIIELANNYKQALLSKIKKEIEIVIGQDLKKIAKSIRSKGAYEELVNYCTLQYFKSATLPIN